MTDQKGHEKLVTYKGAKPQDFEKSEQVVVIGKMENRRIYCKQPVC